MFADPAEPVALLSSACVLLVDIPPPEREGTPPSWGMAPRAASIPPLSPFTRPPLADEAAAAGCPLLACTLPLLRVLVVLLLPPLPRAAAEDCADVDAAAESGAFSFLTGGDRPSRFWSRLRRMLE